MLTLVQTVTLNEEGKYQINLEAVDNDNRPQAKSSFVCVNATTEMEAWEEAAEYVLNFKETFGIISKIPNLAQYKIDAIRKLKDKRNTLEQSGVPYMDTIFDSDQLSVLRINTAVSAAMALGENFSVPWTVQDGSVVTMTAQDMIGLPVALAVMSNELHQKCRQKCEAVELAETIEEVDAILEQEW
jgi:hypothetical protein